MPAKIVVTESKGGSRISLLGSSGKELLGSAVFSEPRAKGATLRALRGLLGEVVVEDHTLAAAKAKPVTTETVVATRTRRSTTRPASKSATKTSAKTSAKAPAKTKTAAVSARRRSAPKAVAASRSASVATAPAASAPKRTAKATPAKTRRTRTAKA